MSPRGRAPKRPRPKQATGAAEHLGIRLRDYDALIRTFIPHYAEMLDRAASAVEAIRPDARVIVDLGVGSGALAARCLAAVSGARAIGIDSDAGMLDAARRRIGPRLTTVCGDFTQATLPQRCDAITASFALHHIPTAERKAAMYRRCARALRPGGVLVSADCFLAADADMQSRNMDAWRAHLQRWYSARQAEAYLRAWADEDVYMPLVDEIRLLDRSGFVPDVIWRRDSFAVIAGMKRANRRRQPSSHSTRRVRRP